MPPDRDAGFFGHPRGLAYLAFTEAWERFSFYGMQALLVLYMINQLLLPGHIENVLGFAGVKAALESVLGPLQTQPLASEIFGLYSGLAYFLPVFGGLLGDRYLGQRLSVTIGAILMAIGHFLMAFEAPFLIALLLLILGCGFLKGNINTQVGRLYAPEDRRRIDGYQVFSIGINSGVLLAPLVCGTLGEVYGWDYGFGAAGIGMLIGLVIYLSGQKYLPPDRIVVHRADAPKLQPGDGKVMAALIFMLLIITLFLTSIGQMGNSYLLWIKAHVDRQAFGKTIPVTWFLSPTALCSILFPPLLLRAWQSQAKRGVEPGMLTKIVFGCGLAAVATLLLAGLSLSIQDGGKIAWPWLLLFHATVSFAYLFAWPVAMALFSKSAPLAVNATFVGVFYFGNFLANTLTGWIGGFYLKMPPAEFWSIQAAIAAAGAILLLAFRPLIGRVLKVK